MAKLGATLTFWWPLYNVNGNPLIGASVTCNIYKPDNTCVVLAGSATEAGDAGYYYAYPSNDAVGVWRGVAYTTHPDVDVNGVPCHIEVVAADYYATDISTLATAAALADVAERTTLLPDDPATATNQNALLAGIGAVEDKIDALDVVTDAAALTLSGVDEKLDTLDGKADAVIDDIYALTHTPDGDPVTRVIPPPDASGYCKLYALCYDPASRLPLDSVTASARIVSLPYLYDGKLHSGQVYPGTYVKPGVPGYNPLVGAHVYWEIVWGATIDIIIEETGVRGRGTVPADTATFSVPELLKL